MGGYYWTTKEGDMWDLIAWKVYGDESRTDLLMSAPQNAEFLTTTIFLDGVRIWCPYFDAEDPDVEEELPPWRDTE